MKDLFKKYLAEKHWLIEEQGWNKRMQGVNESVFSLGNGYIGSRAVLEEIPYDAYPGTYISGIYDEAAAFVTELVNLPNPLNFIITISGEKLDLVAMDVLRHRRILDMKKGTLFRRTLFLNAKKRKFDYQSLRFFSIDDLHLGLMQIYFTPLDDAEDIVVQAPIDTSVTNRGVLTEGRKKHFQITEIDRKKDMNLVLIKTFESKISVGYASSLKIFDGRKEFVTSETMLKLKVEKNKTIRFTKLFVIYTSREIKEKKLKAHCINHLHKTLKKEFNELFSLHKKAWLKRWEMADIIIKPDRDLGRALRFNIYHLLIAAPPLNCALSIPARTLTGEGYRGHIFWDAEMFILPFFIYTAPSVAKNMLLYRYNRLNQAKILARERGFKGALFPWESADKGTDVTPPWHKDLDGRIIRIKTGELEQHISLDIAWGVYHYYLTTGDEEFMRKYGFEMIFETARFWASRTEKNKEKDTYHIKGVVGPDEFHEDVCDNAYTNYLAKYNLLTASQLYRENIKSPKGDFKNLIKRLGIDDKEIDFWEEVERKIYFNKSKDNLIEEFAGYFKKRYIRIDQLNKHFIPLIPKGISLKEISSTQLIKQPDVVMLLYLFSDKFDLGQIKRNFLFYDKRNLHKSSLSPSISAIVGWQVGEYAKAYHYFLYSLYADLKNLHGNTSDGIHAANLGGSWQAVINGFCGMRIKDGILSFAPHLPARITSVRFKMRYKNFLLSVFIKPKKVEIFPISLNKNKKLKLRIHGISKELSCSKRFIFKKD